MLCCEVYYSHSLLSGGFSRATAPLQPLCSLCHSLTSFEVYFSLYMHYPHTCLSVRSACNAYTFSCSMQHNRYMHPEGLDNSFVMNAIYIKNCPNFHGVPFGPSVLERMSGHGPQRNLARRSLFACFCCYFDGMPLWNDSLTLPMPSCSDSTLSKEGVV